MLVDDRVDFRDACGRMLEILGYSVLTADNGDHAMRLIAESVDNIDLLITDVVMPGMNGNELWKHLHVSNPNLKCLFMSGYAADILDEVDLMGEDVQVISKPFSTRALRIKIREVLDT